MKDLTGIQKYLDKLKELEADMGCECVICFHPSGAGWVMEEQTDRFVLDFSCPSEALSSIQEYIDMPTDED